MTLRGCSRLSHRQPPLALARCVSQQRQLWVSPWRSWRVLASTDCRTTIIRHAVNHAVVAIASGDQLDFSMLIGPDVAGRLMEIGILSADDMTTSSTPCRRGKST